MDKKETIIVNLLGGPGLGKSTTSALVFAKLKQAGIDCELVPEFAKDLVWEARHETFNDQIYLFGKQQHRISRLNGKVDVIITDSPLILNIYYGSNNKPLINLVISEVNKYNNRNYFLTRVKEYNPNGRNQTESEAREIDIELRSLLKKYKIKYKDIIGDKDAADEIVKDILTELKGE